MKVKVYLVPTLVAFCLAVLFSVSALGMADKALRDFNMMDAAEVFANKMTEVNNRIQAGDYANARDEFLKVKQAFDQVKGTFLEDWRSMLVKETAKQMIAKMDQIDTIMRTVGARLDDKDDIILEQSEKDELNQQVSGVLSDVNSLTGAVNKQFGVLTNDEVLKLNSAFLKRDVSCQMALNPIEAAVQATIQMSCILPKDYPYMMDEARSQELCACVNEHYKNDPRAKEENKFARNDFSNKLYDKLQPVVQKRYALAWKARFDELMAGASQAGLDEDRSANSSYKNCLAKVQDKFDRAKKSCENDLSTPFDLPAMVKEYSNPTSPNCVSKKAFYQVMGAAQFFPVQAFRRLQQPFPGVTFTMISTMTDAQVDDLLKDYGATDGAKISILQSLKKWREYVQLNPMIRSLDAESVASSFNRDPVFKQKGLPANQTLEECSDNPGLGFDVCGFRPEEGTCPVLEKLFYSDVVGLSDDPSNPEKKGLKSEFAGRFDKRCEMLANALESVACPGSISSVDPAQMAIDCHDSPDACPRDSKGQVDELEVKYAYCIAHQNTNKLIEFTTTNSGQNKEELKAMGKELLDKGNLAKSTIKVQNKREEMNRLTRLLRPYSSGDLNLGENAYQAFVQQVCTGEKNANNNDTDVVFEKLMGMKTSQSPVMTEVASSVRKTSDYWDKVCVKANPKLPAMKSAVTYIESPQYRASRVSRTSSDLMNINDIATTKNLTNGVTSNAVKSSQYRDESGGANASSNPWASSYSGASSKVVEAKDVATAKTARDETVKDLVEASKSLDKITQEKIERVVTSPQGVTSADIQKLLDEIRGSSNAQVDALMQRLKDNQKQYEDLNKRYESMRSGQVVPSAQSMANGQTIVNSNVNDVRANNVAAADNTSVNLPSTMKNIVGNSDANTSGGANNSSNSNGRMSGIGLVAQNQVADIVGESKDVVYINDANVAGEYHEDYLREKLKALGKDGGFVAIMNGGEYKVYQCPPVEKGQACILKKQMITKKSDKKQDKKSKVKVDDQKTKVRVKQLNDVLDK